ncbi:hypothetical protein [Burkholderia glumae]
MPKRANQKPVALSPTEVFLSDVRQSPAWLASNWGAQVMIASFGQSSTYRLDFSPQAFAGKFNHATCHRRLVEDIYDFLCVHAHRSARSKRTRSLNSHKDHFVDSLYIVDYLLLNGNQLGIFEFGFGAIVGMHLKQMLAARASSNDLLTGLMQWPLRLSNFLKEGAAKISDEDVELYVSECPALSVLDIPEEEWSVSMTAQELVRARCWLWANGYYTSRNYIDYKYAPNASRLGKEVYKGTLWVHREEISKEIFEELCVDPIERLVREHPGVAVRSGAADDACSHRAYGRFKATLLKAQLLSNVGQGFPLQSVEDVVCFELPDAVRLKPEGRYVSAPPAYVLNASGKAISFFLQHSRHLLSSYARVVVAAKKASLSVKDYVSQNGIAHLLHPDTKALGITSWSLSDDMNSERLARGTRSSASFSTSEFFARFRANEGLRELVQALYGAMQLVVGVLMAPRQGELLDLPLDCLDETREWMTLMSRKTGFDGLRHEDERPIPYIAARIVRRLQAFHAVLRSSAVETPNLLFALPNTKGQFAVCHKQYNTALDRFMDYIDAPLTCDGRRYYLRQHQLRRLFALLFYLSPYYGTLEDLRWMLRHIDSRHLEHYITQAFKGEQLASIRAEALSIILREKEDVMADLAAFVKRHFGTRYIDLMTDEGFEEYVRYLQKKQLDGSIVVTSVMYETPDGTRHDIALAVFED